MGARSTVTAVLLALTTFATTAGVQAAADARPAGSTSAARPAPAVETGRPEPGRARSIVVEGVVERLMAVGTDGREAVRYLLRTDGPTFHLRTGRDLRTGARIRVTGTRTGLVLRASEVLLLAPPAARRTAARTPAATKILAMRVYWGASRSRAPGTTDFRRLMITDANTWFAEVSHGRYAVSGSVTPWLKIRAPRACGDVDTIMTRALAAAKARGFRGLHLRASHRLRALQHGRDRRAGVHARPEHLALPEHRPGRQRARARTQPRARPRQRPCVHAGR